MDRDLRSIYNAYKRIVESSDKIKESFKSELYGTKDYSTTIAIMTANNPLKTKLGAYDNNMLNSKLGADIENKGCRYRKVKGQYGSKENSYMIIGISLEEAKELAAKYCQESFIFADIKKRKGAKNRRSNLDYQFWQLGSDYYQSCLEEFVSLNEDLGVEAKRDENEHITKVNLAGDVDVEDSLEFPEVDPNEYHIFTKRDITNDMAGEDDYFSQFKDFKFSIPFFDDKGDDTTEDD